MAKKVVLFLVVMVAVWGACSAACNLNLQNLMTCKPAVAESNPTNPSTACCQVVKGLTESDIQCLCDYKKNNPGTLKLLGVDPGRCTQLPALCNLSTPVNC